MASRINPTCILMTVLMPVLFLGKIGEKPFGNFNVGSDVEITVLELEIAELAIHK